MDVKLYPDLFPPAHRAGEGALLRVWYLARSTGTQAGYRVGYEELVAEIVRYLAVKERYARQLLEQGDGTWWRLDKKHGLVYLVGVKAIAARLDCTFTDAPAVRVPREKLSRLGTFYATCYAAYMRRYVKGDRSLPVSRAMLMETFGVTRNTLRRWEKAAGVVVLENYAFAPPSMFPSLPERHFEYHCACGQAFNSFEKYVAHRAGLMPDGVTPDPNPCPHKEYILVWQRPNSYMPPDLPTAGTASPICRSRMTAYLSRRSRTPNAPKCQEASSGSATTPVSCTHTDLHSRTVTCRYRPVRSSDAIPDAFLRTEFPLTRLSRAVRVCN